MSRYFFDLHDGEKFTDDTGLEFASVEDALHHAVNAVAELLMRNPAKFWSGKPWVMEVKDDLGMVLFTLNFAASEAPIIQGLAAQAQAETQPG